MKTANLSIINIYLTITILKTLVYLIYYYVSLTTLILIVDNGRYLHKSELEELL